MANFRDFGSGRVLSITPSTVTFAAGAILPDRYPFSMAYWRAKDFLPAEDNTRRIIRITGHQNDDTYTYTSDYDFVPLANNGEYWAFNMAEADFMSGLDDARDNVETVAIFTANDEVSNGILSLIPGSWDIRSVNSALRLGLELSSEGTIAMKKKFDDRLIHVIIETQIVDDRGNVSFGGKTVSPIISYNAAHTIRLDDRRNIMIIEERGRTGDLVYFQQRVPAQTMSFTGDERIVLKASFVS